MLAPRILILEDKPVHQRLMYLLAKRVGLIPVVATNCPDGIRQLEQGQPFSAVFIDFDIPHNVEGTACVQDIKRFCAKRGRQVPIIAMTAYALDVEREQCFQAGVDDYLSKPFTAKEFEDVVHRWIDMEKRRTSRAS